MPFAIALHREGEAATGTHRGIRVAALSARPVADVVGTQVAVPAIEGGLTRGNLAAPRSAASEPLQVACRLAKVALLRARVTAARPDGLTHARQT